MERCLALVLRLVRRSLGEVGSFSEGGCEADSVGDEFNTGNDPSYKDFAPTELIRSAGSIEENFDSFKACCVDNEENSI